MRVIVIPNIAGLVIGSRIEGGCRGARQIYVALRSLGYAVNIGALDCTLAFCGPSASRRRGDRSFLESGQLMGRSLRSRDGVT
jgi:hypothetical protein